MSTVLPGSPIPKPRKPNGARLSKDDVCVALNIGYHEYYRIYLDTKSRVPDDVVPNYGFWKVVPDDLKTSIAEEVRARHDCLKPCTDNWAAMHILYEVWRSRQVYNQVRTRQQESQASREASVTTSRGGYTPVAEIIPPADQHREVKAEGGFLSAQTENQRYWSFELSPDRTSRVYRLLQKISDNPPLYSPTDTIATVRQYRAPPPTEQPRYYSDIKGLPINADMSSAPTKWEDVLISEGFDFSTHTFVGMDDVVDPVGYHDRNTFSNDVFGGHGQSFTPHDQSQMMDVDDQKMEGVDY